MDAGRSGLRGPGRFTALRQFEIWSCNALFGDCSTDAGYNRVYASAANAFPSDAPRPVAPTLILREFTFSPIQATHLRLVVKHSQCTGGPDFQGEQDADPANATDCNDEGPTSTRFVRAASRLLRAPDRALRRTLTATIAVNVARGERAGPRRTLTREAPRSGRSLDAAVQELLAATGTSSAENWNDARLPRRPTATPSSPLHGSRPSNLTEGRAVRSHRRAAAPPPVAASASSATIATGTPRGDMRPSWTRPTGRPPLPELRLLRRATMTDQHEQTAEDLTAPLPEGGETSPCPPTSRSTARTTRT